MPRCPCLRSGLILCCALLLRGSGQRKSRAGLQVPGMFLSCPGGSLGSEFYLVISQLRLCFQCSLFGETPGRACRVPGTLPAVLVDTRPVPGPLVPAAGAPVCACMRLVVLSRHACASASRPRTQQWSLSTSTVQMQNY